MACKTGIFMSLFLQRHIYEININYRQIIEDKGTNPDSWIKYYTISSTHTSKDYDLTSN